MIEQYGKVATGSITYPILFQGSYVIALNTVGVTLNQGGSSFSAPEGRCMSCNITSYNNTSCSFEYGLENMGTNYSVIWQAKGY